MDLTTFFAGVLLSAALGLAGWAKLSQSKQTEETAKAFGLPSTLASFVGGYLAPFELLVALALLLPFAAWFGAIAASFLLASFIVAMCVRLLQGASPACNCFGQAKPKPITWATVGRTVLLLVAGLLLATAGPQQKGLIHTAVDLAAGPDASTVLLGLLLAWAIASTALIFALLQQQGRSILRIDNLEHRLSAMTTSTTVPLESASHFVASQVRPGSQAPSISASTLGGRTRTLRELLDESGSPIMLLFVGAECAPCRELVKDMLGWRRNDSQSVAWATVATGDVDTVRSAFPGLAVDRVLLQRSSEINDLYGVAATPSAVWIARNEMVASSMAVGHDAIRSLFDRPAEVSGDDFAGLEPALANSR